jgi:sigma-E factor negative regulatory protein RseB
MTPSVRGRALIAGVVGLVGVWGMACAEPDARRWLQEMTDALAGQTYSGEFLHLGNGPVEKLRVFHRVRDGQVTERLVGLGAARREVVRHDDEMQVILPDQGVVLIETAPAAGSLLGVVPTFETDVEEQYRVEFAGAARVINRAARVVAVVPKDRYRFGYRLWIDEATHMPLRTDLIDATGRVLEQVVFTGLELGVALPDAVFRPANDTTRYSVVREQPRVADATGHADAWTVSRLPPGYRIRSRSVERLPGSGTPSTHLLISDGLATVSVFIEEPPAPPRQAVEGEGRLGSAYAYSRLVAGHQVTAVGEVPAATVELVAAAVTPQAGAHVELSEAPPLAPLVPAPRAGARPHRRP